jgi:hypothetical protein
MSVWLARVLGAAVGRRVQATEICGSESKRREGWVLWFGVGCGCLICVDDIARHLDEIKYARCRRFLRPSDCRFRSRNRGSMDFVLQDQRLGTAARLFQLNELMRLRSGIEMIDASELCCFKLNQQRGKPD